jgi:hypothetical protein
VVTAGAAEPVGTGAAAGLDAGWLGAAAERDGDLAGGAAGVLGIQQRLGRSLLLPALARIRVRVRSLPCGHGKSLDPQWSP